MFCSEKSDLCKCQLWLEIAEIRYYTSKYVFLCVLRWKISFVHVLTLTLNCANAIIHGKTRLFECFTVENPICATVYSNFKLHKCNIPPQNMSFWVFWSRKSDLCKCQFWLETAQMQYSTPKHVFLYVLRWKISIMQLPTLTLSYKITIINRKTRLLECLTGKNPICATVNSDFKL